MGIRRNLQPKKKYQLFSAAVYWQNYKRRQRKVLLFGTSITSFSVLIITIFSFAMFTGYSDNISHSTSLTAGSKKVTAHKTVTRLAITSAKSSKGGVTTTLQQPITFSAARGVAISKASVTGNPSWTKLSLYNDPTNEATQYYDSDPGVTGAATIERMGLVPVSEWFGDWTSGIESSVNAYVSSAAQVNAVPVLVLYNIPERDCGGNSTGGAASASAYDQWVQQVSSGIGNNVAVIILEPDALGDLDCLSAPDQQSRLSAMSQAVTILKTHPNTFVYIDAGNASWEPASVMADRLSAANINQADGFSLNVSYFDSTASNQAYGDQLSKLVGNKHYVIDTSRNGAGGILSGTVCNPSGAALGSLPGISTGDRLNDAFLWIKIPWESDGPCNGGPAPGDVFWSYALELAHNAGWN